MRKTKHRATSFLDDWSRQRRRPVQRRPPAPPAFRSVATLSFADLTELIGVVREQSQLSTLVARLSLDPLEVAALEERLRKLHGSPSSFWNGTTSDLQLVIDPTSGSLSDGSALILSSLRRAAITFSADSKCDQ